MISLGFAVPARIKGNFKNIHSPYVFVYKYFGPELTKIDSVKHEAGNYQFKFKDIQRGFYRIGEDEQLSAMVVLGEDNLVINADLKDLPNSVKVENSKENNQYQKFRIFNDKHSQQVNILNQKAQSISSEHAGNQAKYQTEINKLQFTLDSLNALQKQFYRTNLKESQGLFFGKFMSMFNFPDSLTRETFFRKEDMEDEELTRGDMMPSKISFFLQRFVEPNLDQWKLASQEVLNQAIPGTKNKEVIYLTFIKLFLPYDEDQSRRLANAYLKEFPNSYYAKRALASLPKGTPVVGEAAPEITLPDPTGKNVSLSSLKGKVVLLDFWASWCGPCRKENPNVVNVYKKYKDKGFTVYSVSLDNAKANWVDAISKDNLIWTSHVSDLKGWKSSAAALYGVKGIPATFLIDQQGKIIAVNLRGETLEESLKSLLGE
jgi:thiol-disulfide isomerase/thioredoxin